MVITMLVIYLWMLFGLAYSTDVELESSWKKDFGWEVTFTWKLYSNDSLQSVRLYNNSEQFMVYRPENGVYHRSQIFRLPKHTMEADCTETADRGIQGKCVITVELNQPQTNDFVFNCEVSGDRPWFRIGRQRVNLSAFVPPSDATLTKSWSKEQSNRVDLNCTSNGTPPPTLVWTIGDRKIPHDFTDSYWNISSKLWHVWSQMSYAPTYESPLALCTPEVSRDGKLYKGNPAEYMYNSASIFSFCVYLLWLPILLR